jgi:F-type H+-transporting ATPase subunit b
LDGIATGLAKLPEETRASIGSEDQPIRLTAARPVTPEEEGACRRTLASVFGRPVTIEISVDPTLIAGIELEGPQAIVRNSFRADLILLKSKLVHHDTSNG